jgi:hypothetical protein
VNRSRAPSLARKRLVDQTQWIENNTQLHLNTSKLSKMTTPFSTSSPTVDDTETYWRDLSSLSWQLIEAPSLTRFRKLCDGTLVWWKVLTGSMEVEVRRVLNQTAYRFDPSGLNILLYLDFVNQLITLLYFCHYNFPVIRNAYRIIHVK